MRAAQCDREVLGPILNGILSAFSTGCTVYAKGSTHQDTRVELERVAGGLLEAA
jgi:hypothetical protein